MLNTNRGFITPDGRYYEAPFPLSPDHREAVARNTPEPSCPPHGDVAPSQHSEQRTSRMDGNHQYPQPAPQQQPQPYTPPPQQIPGVNAPYTINQDSQFNFKLKDVLIIAGAIASAAVSWNNADGRLSRLEERVSTDIVKKIESIERKQDENIKAQADSIKALSSQIADLERAIASGRK
jgi:hypothetical protein